MSKVTLSAMSFVAGMFCMFLIASGSHTSTFAQAPTPAPTPAPSGPLGAKINGVPMPDIPPIGRHFEHFGVSGAPSDIGVDGLECVSCSFTGATLRYSGGNFNLSNFTISGPIRVELTGAAKNTVIFLNFVQGLTNGQAPTKAPNKNQMQIVSVKGTVKGSVDTEE